MKLRKKTALPLLDLESSSSGSEYGEAEEGEYGSTCPSDSASESTEWETDEEGEQPGVDQPATEQPAGTAGLLLPGDSEDEGAVGDVSDAVAVGPSAGSPFPQAQQPGPVIRSAVQPQPSPSSAFGRGGHSRTGSYTTAHPVCESHGTDAAFGPDESAGWDPSPAAKEAAASSGSEDEDEGGRAPSFNPFSLLTSSDDEEHEEEEDEAEEDEEDAEKWEEGDWGADAESEEDGEQAEDDGYGERTPRAAAAVTAGDQDADGGGAVVRSAQAQVPAASLRGPAVLSAALSAGLIADPAPAPEAGRGGAAAASAPAGQHRDPVTGALSAGGAGGLEVCAPEVDPRCGREQQHDADSAHGPAVGAPAAAVAGPHDGTGAGDTRGPSAPPSAATSPPADVQRLMQQLPCSHARAHTAAESGVVAQEQVGVLAAAAAAAAAGVQEEGSRGDPEAAECWVCYGGGRPAGCSLGSNAAGGGDAAAAGGDAEELVAPCRVCSGGVRYIHVRCFMQWLDSSWAVTCPNCRTLYDRSVLDAFTDSGSLRALWAAASPPSHDPRRPFPLHSMAHFCVGGSVEVAFHVGGLTAVQLLRRIKAMTDEWRLAGADGGLGLVRADGSRLELPSFEVTGLVLELGGAEEEDLDPWDRVYGGRVEDVEQLSDEADETWDPVPSRRSRGGSGPVGAYEGGDADSDMVDDFSRRPRSPPPGAARAHAGGSGSGSSSSSQRYNSLSRRTHTTISAELHRLTTAHMQLQRLQGMDRDIAAVAAAAVASGAAAHMRGAQQQEPQGAGQPLLAAAAVGTAGGLFGDLRVPWLTMLQPGDAAVSALVADWQRGGDVRAAPLPAPVRVDDDFARSAVERAAQRAEQRRRREEAMRQQRVLTQRHVAQQTRQYANGGGNRFAGGGRRRQ
ncbi:hypothetical protein HYH02_004767 [Chlamydomonas schloesseri]|uniref:RING-CH-type domain-containing protein n=1 Tax=Chlamydomonas schloesseri TaxID=2026947 RepID=A0A835WNQ0_9CHLO|nr:hypothetical protein HYH02_004767 [Chlamydomonas schloesseri]|eukprot:KAG2450256.1 hypothetical protein HYH02_004767 [Chlamydomonas schloesseri]